MCQSASGKWVFLTVQVLFLQAVYHFLSALSEILDYLFEGYSVLGPLVYSICPVINGLACTTFSIFFVLSILSDTLLPHWREQWGYYEAYVECGYFCKYYGMNMYVMHVPIVLASIIDINTKQPSRISTYTAGPSLCLGAVSLYNVLFQGFLAWNYERNNKAIPYPWHYDMPQPWYKSWPFVVYFFAVNAVIYSIVCAVRGALLQRAPPCA